MKILVATDGSNCALRAVEYAAKLARSMPASSNTITLISVHDDAGLRHVKAFVGSEGVADYLRELSEKELKAARELLDAADLKYHIEIRTGQVAREIVDCADTGHFDLLVLGAKGRGAMADLLIGSVAQRVLATVTTPVLLVK